MRKKVRMGLFAPSSSIDLVLLEESKKELTSWAELIVRDEIFLKHFLYAGTDEQRARAVWELAWESSLPVLWAVRGGYGAMRLLPFLNAWTQQEGVPPEKKLCVGFSDVTALHVFVQERWGWNVLHAPMPAHEGFLKMDPREKIVLKKWIEKIYLEPSYQGKKLHFLNHRSKPLKQPVEGILRGGNLSVWVSLLGTTWMQSASDQKWILFLEEVGETYGKIDRMVQQLRFSKIWKGCQAILLGTWTDCKETSKGKKQNSPSKIPFRKALEEIFSPLEEEIGIPVFYGLSVGHGVGMSPLPLGARVQIQEDGTFLIKDWSWWAREEKKLFRS